jgi:UDP-N-acetylmuramoyl-tripeptide--D-alanyl-D-alanine ligase
MEEQTLHFIAKSCGGRLINAQSESRVRNISTDSRTVQAGDLFAAVPGDNFDGHDFLADVCAKGAVAALVEETRVTALPPRFAAIAVSGTRRALGRIAAAYRKHFDLSAVAIAGSNGKTSTKELLASVLRQKLEIVSSAASFNNDLGVPLTIFKIERHHQAGVFEVGTNHPGELRPLIEMIQPTAGIMTSIGREHLEFFGNIEGVLEEEGALAELLPASGFLVVNGEGYGAARLARRTRARVIRIGTGPRCDWRISDVGLGESGSRFRIETNDPEFCGEYQTKLLGAHQVVNATYAAVVGKELGLGRAEIQRGLASCSGAKMRLQLKHIDDFVLLDDAYNANADSMQAALDTLEKFPCKGRRIAVLGEMAELGEASLAAHQEIGRRAGVGIDCLVAVGRNSDVMAAAARSAGMRDVIDLPEAERAGAVVTELVRPGDVVLVKASRSARLERVVEFLSARFGVTEPKLA